jgi:membrane dipeptidase
MLVVDAHEDLAWNILTFQRDYLRPVAETRRLEIGSEAVQENGESCIGYPEWIEGKVAIVFATLFAAPRRSTLGAVKGESSYSTTEEAYTLYKQQIDTYHHWVKQTPDKLTLVDSRAALEEVLATWADGYSGQRKVGLVILMEGADGVRTPAEVSTWKEWGVRLIGPAWNRTQYVGGTGEPGGFTDSGLHLLQAMTEHDLILDLSHLADEAVPQAFEHFPGMIVATHANARALLPSARAPERHLTDAAIKGVAERNGVVGVVLANFFLRDGYGRDSQRTDVTLDHIAAHIDHMAQLVGNTRHIGIGSDFDGGFGLSRIPTGIDSVADLQRIGGHLSQRNYSDSQIEGILGGNWLRVLRDTLA